MYGDYNMLDERVGWVLDVRAYCKCYQSCLGKKFAKSSARGMVVSSRSGLCFDLQSSLLVV